MSPRSYSLSFFIRFISSSVFLLSTPFFLLFHPNNTISLPTSTQLGVEEAGWINVCLTASNPHKRRTKTR